MKTIKLELIEKFCEELHELSPYPQENIKITLDKCHKLELLSQVYDKTFSYIGKEVPNDLPDVNEVSYQTPFGVCIHLKFK